MTWSLCRRKYIRKEVSWLDWKGSKHFQMQWETSLEVLRLLTTAIWWIIIECLETIFIKSCKEFDPSILDSKEIIESILKKENISLFRNVKVNIHPISVESVVESLVSRYEKHFNSSRQPTLQHSLDEMIIAAENRPLLHHADEILERVINQYWRVGNRDGKWHFCDELKTYIHIPETAIKLLESCWTKSLNYHSCKTLHVRYHIF